ncbi:MAG: neutral/alkaline non-lysosomal ceramidase N-terminal domain-containing protein [Gemmataceae bacterium]
MNCIWWMLLLIGWADLHEPGTLHAGASQVDITPPVGGPMWGYAARHENPSTGVRDRLQARCLVLDTGGVRVAFVSLDLGRALPRREAAHLQDLARKHGIETLFVAASHTHHGPMLEIDTWPTTKTSYVHSLPKKLAQCIGQAVAALEPARIGIAGKQVPLNRNRHTDDGAADRELLVLRAESLKGQAIGHLVNFAAHPTMLSLKDTRWSADWVGAMAAAVEKETKAPCVFLQGAAGDLSPYGSSELEKFGIMVAREVIQLLPRIKTQDSVKAWKTHDERLTFRSRVNLEDPVVRLTMSLAFSPRLVNFFRNEYKDGIHPRLTTALLDGRIGFVGVSGECFAEHALHLKRRAKLEHLFFIGYCNDYHQYFPSIQAAARGGYGTEIYIAPAELGAGEKLMDRALLQLFAHQGKWKIVR